MYIQPVQSDGGDGARGYGDVGALGGRHGLAHEQAPSPPAGHERPQRERHAHRAHDDVGERQVDDVQVARRRALAGHVLLAALPEHDEAHQPVGHQPDDEQHAVRDHDGHLQVQHQNLVAVQLVLEQRVHGQLDGEVERARAAAAAVVAVVERVVVARVAEKTAAGPTTTAAATAAFDRRLDQRGHHGHEPVEVVLVQFGRIEHNNNVLTLFRYGPPLSPIIYAGPWPSSCRRHRHRLPSWRSFGDVPRVPMVFTGPEICKNIKNQNGF